MIKNENQMEIIKLNLLKECNIFTSYNIQIYANEI